SLLPARLGSICLGGEQRRWFQLADFGLVEIGVVRVGGVIAIRSGAQLPVAEAHPFSRVDRGGIERSILGKRRGCKAQRGNACEGSHSRTMAPPLSALSCRAAMIRLSRSPISPGVRCGVLVRAASENPSS